MCGPMSCHGSSPGVLLQLLLPPSNATVAFLKAVSQAMQPTSLCAVASLFYVALALLNVNTSDMLHPRPCPTQSYV